MNTINLSLNNETCSVVINDTFKEFKSAVSKCCRPNNILFITDTNVEKLYYSQVTKELKDLNINIEKLVLESGEKTKNLKTVQKIYMKCVDLGLSRNDCIAALGGGVIGDIAGFAASTYMRGLNFIQIPTTVIAQTDSSIGGKTGVNLKSLKNYIGTFYIPKLIYINTESLLSLPKREFVSGVSEVIKYGTIYNAALLDFLERYSENILSMEIPYLNHIVNMSCSIKTEIVQKDGMDRGIRQILNYGHTIGHAIESESKFNLLHGECVALGMISEAKIALERKLIDDEYYLRIIKIISKFGLPIKHKFNMKKAAELVKKDKKLENKRIKFLLPTSESKIIIADDINEEEIEMGMNEILLK